MLGLPVYNLGTYAGPGLRPILADAREVARPGDHVLLYLEDSHYRRETATVLEGEEQVLWTNTPARVFRLPWAEMRQELYGHPAGDYALGWSRRNEALRSPGGAEEIPGQAYSAVELGPRGDYRGRATVPEKGFAAAGIRPVETVKRASAEELERFLRWCTARGIHVLATLPATMRPDAGQTVTQERGARVLRAFYEKHGARFFHLPALDALPRELMLDTAYHANAAGRRIVTQLVGEALAPLLGDHAPPAGEAWLLVKSPHAMPGLERVFTEANFAEVLLSFRRGSAEPPLPAAGGGARGGGGRAARALHGPGDQAAPGAGGAHLRDVNEVGAPAAVLGSGALRTFLGSGRGGRYLGAGGGAAGAAARVPHLGRALPGGPFWHGFF